MAELLYDQQDRPVVVVAGARRHVPQPMLDREEGPCPFCPGNEALAGLELDRRELYSGGPWQARAIRNKYPVLHDGPGQHAHGAHEVLVWAPDHSAHLGSGDIDAATVALELLADRVSANFAQGWPCALPLINNGTLAGASQPHPHAQVLSMGFVPPRLDLEADIAQEADHCAYCHPATDLVVHQSANYTLQVTGLPSVPYEILLFPREHQARQAHDQGTRELAKLLDWAVREATARARTEAFNLIWHLAPLGAVGFHWHVHLLARRVSPGALEYGAGLVVLSSTPEEYAAELRAVQPR